MKRDLNVIVVLVVVFMNSTVAMAGATNTEKTDANLAYYKAGVLWDINGLTYDATNANNIRDLHMDGQISYLKDLFGLENVNYKKKFNLGFLNLTMVFLVSREPLP